MITFIANDGKEYLADTWYPLPFIVDGKSMLPVDFDRAGCLRVLLGDETYVWGPFAWSKTPATHWKVQLSGHYEI